MDHVRYCTCPKPGPALCNTEKVEQGTPASSGNHLVTLYHDALAAGDKVTAEATLRLINR